MIGIILKGGTRINNYAGYIEVTEKRLKRDLEIDINILNEACVQMGDNFVKTDRGIWLRNYIRRQVGDGVYLYRKQRYTLRIKAPCR